jgi:RNA polymerase sigma-54 factor
MVQITQKIQMQLKQSPQQVLLSSLLQLPVARLEQRISNELEENPLLELDTEQEMDENEEEEVKEKEEEEGEPEEDLVSEQEEPEVEWEDILNDEDHFEPRVPREKNPDIFERPEVNQETLVDHLLEQLHMLKLTDEEISIGEYIIWNINNVGYLSTEVDTIAEQLNFDEELVEKVLAIIQKFDPTGIASRNLQECLLVQLLEENPRNELAIHMLQNHYDDFKNKRFEKLAKDMGVCLDTIKEIFTHITKLNPKPGEGYISLANQYIVPDIEVRKEDGEYKIIMNDWNIPHLRINNEYRKMMLNKKKTSKETRDYIKKRLESARWLINSIHQRRDTIFRVMSTIIEKQNDFFEYGPDALKPMILKDVADEIHMDISTISRVTNGKYVQTEWGIKELKFFFSEKIRTDEGEDVSNKKIKSLIREIISEESAAKPLNDQKIVNLLKEKGYTIARRTVAKYREQMDIPVARLRRRI